ncbi:DUF6273 domain-containing protein [Holdemanella biformis]
MKNTIKISIMSGLMLAGMALGGVHIANAQTTIDSGYTITIPSEVGIDKDSGKTTFSVTGKVKAQSTIDVSIQSKNGYKLKNKSKELPYSIDKKSFSFDNSKSASDLNINEVFNISSATNTNFSGNYEDNLTFNITGNEYKYRLDINGNLDANGIGDGRLDNFGRFDVYLNGKLAVENAEDYCVCLPYGTVWELKNIRALDGYRYKEDSSIKTKGVIGQSFEYEGHLNGVADTSSIYRISYANLRYYTNKLTINYHADGAQSWKTSNTNNATEVDVSDKDIMETEYLKYNELYDQDAKKQHFCSIARIKRDRYTAKANTWKVGQKGSLEVLDYKTLQKAQDVAEYCGVLNQLKKNDTTIDLYPIWIPNTYTLTYDLNGGSFNSSTTQLFKYGSGDTISSEMPVKAGYSFTGWRWNEVIMQPGDTIPKEWGNFKLTAQWKEIYSMGTILNIDGIEYMVIERQEDGNYLVMTTKSIGENKFGTYFRQDRWNRNCYENSEIDDYLENTWYKGLSTKMQNAIQSTEIRQVSYSDNKLDAEEENGYYYQVYNTISRHVFLPSIKDMAKVVDLSNGEKVKNFLNGEVAVLSRDGHKNYENVVMTVYYDSNHIFTARTEDSVNTRPAFVIDLSKIDYTVTGSVNYKYSKGTTVNIAGSEYIIMDELNGDEYLVISKNTIGNRKFQSDNRLDEQCRSTYEGSAIDNYLENEWYNCLSSTMKAAIQTVNIKQASYATDTNPDSKQETGYNGQVYNTISRQAFLPSVSEIGKAVDLKNPDKVKAFLNGISIWTRDSYQGHANGAEFLLTSTGHLGASYVYYTRGVRPAFVINLSKIENTITGSVSYK